MPHSPALEIAEAFQSGLARGKDDGHGVTVERQQPPLMAALNEVFDVIETSEQIVSRLTDRLQPLLNPSAMDAPAKGNAPAEKHASTSEVVSTVRLAALRLDLINDRFRTLLEALEV